MVRDSDTEHGPGDQGQFMGRERTQILIHGAAVEEVTGRNICPGPAGPSLGPSHGSEAVEGWGRGSLGAVSFG